MKVFSYRMFKTPKNNYQYAEFVVLVSPWFFLDGIETARRLVKKTTSRNSRVSGTIIMSPAEFRSSNWHNGLTSFLKELDKVEIF